jgi:ABC-2 type transport system ATP-binding protein
VTPIIEIEGLTKRYGATVALSSLDLDVEQGEVLGYLGPNGAGSAATCGSPDRWSSSWPSAGAVDDAGVRPKT